MKKKLLSIKGCPNSINVFFNVLAFRFLETLENDDDGEEEDLLLEVLPEGLQTPLVSRELSRRLVVLKVLVVLVHADHDHDVNDDHHDDE